MVRIPYLKTNPWNIFDVEKMKQSYSNYLLLSIFVLLGSYLRFYKLGDTSFWIDEILTAKSAQTSFYNIIFEEFRPPFHIVLTKIFLYLGHSESIIRLPSVISGIFGIFAIYLLGKKVFSSNVGLVGAFLLSISVFHIYYSQDARYYSHMVFFTLMSLYFLFEILEKNHRKYWMGFFLFSLLNIYNHYFGFLITFLEILYLSIIKRKNISHLAFDLRVQIKKVHFKKYTPIFILIVILIFPIFLKFFQSIGDYLTIGIQKSSDKIIETEPIKLSYSFYKDLFIKLNLLFSQQASWMGLRSASFLPLLFFVFLIGFLKNDKKIILLILIWFILPVFILSNFFTGRFFIRYLIFMLPVYLLVVAHGFVIIAEFFFKGRSSKKIVTGALAIVLAASIFAPMSAGALMGYYKSPSNENYKEVAEFLNENAKSGDLVVFFSRNYPIKGLSYYYNATRHGIILAAMDFEDVKYWKNRYHHNIWVVYHSLIAKNEPPEYYRWAKNNSAYMYKPHRRSYLEVYLLNSSKIKGNTTNMLYNGGFEGDGDKDGFPDGWFEVPPTSTRFSAAYRGDDWRLLYRSDWRVLYLNESIEGEKSVGVYEQPYIISKYPVRVEPNTTYLFSYKIKSEEGRFGKVMLKFFRDDNLPMVFWDSDSEIVENRLLRDPANWNDLIKIFTTSPEDKWLWVGFLASPCNPAKSATIIDDAKLIPLSEEGRQEGDNIYYEGDLRPFIYNSNYDIDEDMDEVPDGWHVVSKSGYNIPQLVRFDNYSAVEVTYDGYILGECPIPVLPNNTYKLTVYLRNEKKELALLEKIKNLLTAKEKNKVDYKALTWLRLFNETTVPEDFWKNYSQEIKEEVILEELRNWTKIEKLFSTYGDMRWAWLAFRGSYESRGDIVTQIKNVTISHYEPPLLGSFIHSRIQAEDYDIYGPFKKTVEKMQIDGRNTVSLLENGFVQYDLVFPEPGRYRFTMKAKNSKPSPVIFELRVDDESVGEMIFDRGDGSWSNGYHDFEVPRSGAHYLQVYFTNDFYDPWTRENRDASIDWIMVEKL